MYTILTYHTLDETLLKKWRDLWHKSAEGHFFNTPEWFVVTCHTYHIRRFTLVTIEADGELVLVLPLMTKKMFGIPVLTSPGGKFVNKSSLLLHKFDPAILTMLRNFLMNQGNFYLQELSGEIADTFSQNKRNIIKREASVNPYLPILPDPFSYVSNKNKSQMRGILRKFEKDVEFKYFIGDKDALETVFAIDNRSSKKQQGKATFVTEQDKDFFRSLLRFMPKDVIIDIGYYKEVPIVYGIGFTYKNVFHASLTAFDAQYRSLRPGKLLTYFTLKRLQKEHVDMIDFGRGNSMLKQEFTKLVSMQYDVFYSQSLWERQWLMTGKRMYDSVLHNKSLYSQYLFFKKHVLYR